jgi:hypothetical protein
VRNKEKTNIKAANGDPLAALKNPSLGVRELLPAMMMVPVMMTMAVAGCTRRSHHGGQCYQGQKHRKKLRMPGFHHRLHGQLAAKAGSLSVTPGTGESCGLLGGIA